jgi:hypothetical protein
MSETLHVGQAILDWMKENGQKPSEDPPLSLGHAFWGTPVTLDPDLPSGVWQLRRDSEVLREGRVGHETETVAYVKGVGFVGFHPQTFEVWP